MAPVTAAIITRPPPTRDQWLTLRPEITFWYLHKHRTAGSITKELRARGLIVTNKMLRDRFREWKFPLKYNKGKQNENGSSHESRLKSAVASAISTSPGNVRLTETLTVIGDYLDSIISSESWRWANSKEGLDMQRLAASAHLTITTYGSDCPARYTELLDLGNQVANAMSNCQDASTMHPRVLTVLLRLLVDNYVTAMESNALALVKSMFQILSDLKLSEQHPVRLLCRMNKEQASSLLTRLLLLTETRFYDKISAIDPMFAAREQTYSARVLASVGRTNEATELLNGVLAKFDGRIDTFTMADAHRTLGYAKIISGFLDEAMHYTSLALREFEEAGQGNSDNAMFANMGLAQLHQKPGPHYDLELAEHYAAEAVRIWEFNAASNQGKGGIKLVKDLHTILTQQGKNDNAAMLQQKYPTYFGAGKM